jgi:hypothetical protein
VDQREGNSVPDALGVDPRTLLHHHLIDRDSRTVAAPSKRKPHSPLAHASEQCVELGSNAASTARRRLSNPDAADAGFAGVGSQTPTGRNLPRRNCAALSRGMGAAGIEPATPRV